jgi:hypothetical protein
MKQVFGWWHLDAESRSLVNTVTHERIRFSDSRLVDQPGGVLGSVQLEYEHETIRYPLVAEIVSKLDDTARQWQINHNHSANQWRRENKSDLGYPPFGLWRRVDDCVTDVLACWPHVIVNSFPTIVAFGGWRNGAWDAAMFRSIETIKESVHKTLYAPVTNDDSAALFRIDEPPASPFQFHPFPESLVSPHQKKMPEIAAPLFLEGLTRSPEPALKMTTKLHNHVYHLILPPERKLSGFQGRTAYLLSEDGRRVLYPYDGTSEETARKRSGHLASASAFRFFYADSSVVCDTFASHKHDSWHFRVGASGFGRRSTEVDPSLDLATLWVDGVQGGIQSRFYGCFASRRLSLHLMWAIIDGWSNWQGTNARNSKWAADLTLSAAGELVLLGGYRGGMFSSTFKQQLTVADRTKRQEHA